MTDTSVGQQKVDHPSPRVRLGIDVGGTFTDIAVLDEAEGTVRFDKVATIPKAPAVGVINALNKAQVSFDGVSFFVHGTTLALNALLTRSGVRVALVTTRGFRDVYELGRTDREAMYDLTYRRPPNFVPRYLVFEVDERMVFDGGALVPFDQEQARGVAEQIRAAEVEAVAVCFLHSYANPAHEEAMEAVLRQVCPEVEVTLSHRLLREYREYERTSTAVIDAYIKPVVRRYLYRLHDALADEGFGGRFLVTRSGGGAMTAETAVAQPAHLVLSGPASGVIGATALGDILGERNLITLDMGGTSLDASLIADGEPSTVSEESFEGQAIALQSLNIHTIGAGGGSIAWIDEAGHLQVGPQSAGADPGPASYGRGGDDVTVTDAALLIGYLGEKTALGGELNLVRHLAESALERPAGKLGLSALDVAHGVMRIVTTKITGAVREITVEQGHDPSDFALLSYGGGGGLIAATVARDLGIPRVILPPGPGAFSAFGMLFTDVVHDLAQTNVAELEALDPAELNGIYEGLAARGREVLERDGFGSDRSTLQRTADLRFAGQEHTVEAPVPAGVLSTGDLRSLAERFASLHLERYGHRMSDPVELVTARLRAVGAVPRPRVPEVGPGSVERARIGQREVYQGADVEPIGYDVYRREDLGHDCVVEGPAIVEEHTATTVLHRGDVLEVGRHGELLITIRVKR